MTDHILFSMVNLYHQTDDARIWTPGAGRQVATRTSPLLIARAPNKILMNIRRSFLDRTFKPGSMMNVAGQHFLLVADLNNIRNQFEVPLSKYKEHPMVEFTEMPDQPMFDLMHREIELGILGETQRNEPRNQWYLIYMHNSLSKGFDKTKPWEYFIPGEKPANDMVVVGLCDESIADGLTIMLREFSRTRNKENSHEGGFFYRVRAGLKPEEFVFPPVDHSRILYSWSVMPTMEELAWIAGQFELTEGVPSIKVDLI